MMRMERVLNTDPHAAGNAASLAARGNRRRLAVFGLVFAVVLAAVLIWDFSRPPQYRAGARLSIKPASVVSAPAKAGAGGEASAAFSESGSVQNEVQVLSSRPLLVKALAGLAADERAGLGEDPAATAAAMLSVEVVPGTSFVQVYAVGPRPAQLAALINALLAAYRDQVLETYATNATDDLDKMRDEVERLKASVDAKRRAAEQFRLTNDIVSLEREENLVIARVKGLSASLNTANENVASAEGKLRSLRDSLAAGRAVVRSRDNPTLAALESRASQIRESLRELERTYTPEYLAMDPNVRGQRSRLADLERQMNEVRASSAQAAISEAEEALSAAHQAQQRLQQQISGERQGLQSFSSRYNTYKAMQDDLTQIETTLRASSDRLLRSEASAKSRQPVVQVLEAAALPREVWQPQYWRDAALGCAAAFLFGLVAMGLVELFNRPPRADAAPVIVSQPWVPVPVGAGLDMRLAAQPAAPVLEAARPAQNAPLLATPPAALPRELEHAEMVALLEAARAPARLGIALLLQGLSVAEVLALDWSDVDVAAPALAVRGEMSRRIVPAPAACAVLARSETRAGPLCARPDGCPQTEQDLCSAIICAAHDAGIVQAADISPQVLRHTAVCHLVRQGIRFSDLDKIVGRLAPDMLAAYAPLAPAGRRRDVAEVELLLPALLAAEAV
ncbi:MAG: tyrosine-type recombinase/integrase [Rhodocyclaceae bacterium]|nr:tyrosine-type recombinase/integrase [Rhodocyclaceae bacterium]MBX3667568.1 tyrosine-type recombinase/integrase [Rhodocyclaceae bacterium]